MPKPDSRTGIGIDALPDFIRNSNVLTGNHLGLLAGIEKLPSTEPTFTDSRLDALLYYFKNDKNIKERIHEYARELLDEGKTAHAWQVLIAVNNSDAHTS